ncbi:SH3-domain-containing protein [Mycena floridula]|nr:SH3-domain-containing protein [Mycena floridula]
MVFSNLPHHEKDAFFSLLDEYFQSRPELAASLQSSGTDVAATAGRVASAASAFAAKSPSSPPPQRVPYKSTVAATGLVTGQRIGGIDTSTKTNMLTSGFRKTPATTPPVAPPAFNAPKKSAFTPRQPDPEPEEEETAGEWAEALYDYNSGDPGDLNLQENQRVLVTERTSGDWWTGEAGGKTGLFPASYVKLL